MLKLGIAFLQAAALVFTYLERQRLMAEGERQQVAKELASVARAAAVSKRVREEVDALSAKEVDSRLADDFRS